MTSHLQKTGTGNGNLNDPEFCNAVAELWVNGYKKREMADTLGVSVSSITAYIKDPRVTAISRRLAVERVTRITRKIDGEFEKRMATQLDDIPLQDLLKMRREFLERPLSIEAEDSTDLGKVANELADLFENNPSLQAEFKRMMHEQETGAITEPVSDPIE